MRYPGLDLLCLVNDPFRYTIALILEVIYAGLHGPTALSPTGAAYILPSGRCVSGLSWPCTRKPGVTRTAAAATRHHCRCQTGSCVAADRKPSSTAPGAGILRSHWSPNRINSLDCPHSPHLLRPLFSAALERNHLTLTRLPGSHRMDLSSWLRNTNRLPPLEEVIRISFTK